VKQIALSSAPCPKGPGQTENVWPPNTIKHCLEANHANVEVSGQKVSAWTNDKCLATKHHQTLFGDQTFYCLDTLFGAV